MQIEDIRQKTLSITDEELDYLRGAFKAKLKEDGYTYTSWLEDHGEQAWRKGNLSSVLHGDMPSAPLIRKVCDYILFE